MLANARDFGHQSNPGLTLGAAAEFPGAGGWHCTSRRIPLIPLPIRASHAPHGCLHPLANTRGYCMAVAWRSWLAGWE